MANHRKPLPWWQSFLRIVRRRYSKLVRRYWKHKLSRVEAWVVISFYVSQLYFGFVKPELNWDTAPLGGIDSQLPQSFLSRLSALSWTDLFLLKFLNNTACSILNSFFITAWFFISKRHFKSTTLHRRYLAAGTRTRKRGQYSSISYFLQDWL